MFTAIATGISFKKNFGVEKALIVSVFFLLLFHPAYLFDAGFQLSYLAVFFIVKLQPEMADLYNPKNKVIRYFWLLFTVTLAAQAGVFPLSLYYFHQFPALFFVSGLVIIPLLGFVLGSGILVIFLALLHSLPGSLAEIYGGIISFMNSFVTLIAHQEHFIFQNIHISFVMLTVLYLMLFSLILFLQKRNYNRSVLMLGSLILIEMLILQQKYQKQSTREFVIFDQYKNTLIADRKGDSLQVFTGKTTADKNPPFVIKDYLSGTGSFKRGENLPVKNIYRIDHRYLLVIDSSAVFLPKKGSFKWILLRQSPKINLERVIRELRPEMIIADNSNYRTYTECWEKTAAEYGVKFQTTSRSAFRYRY
jgi:competence protein ComEC